MSGREATRLAMRRRGQMRRRGGEAHDKKWGYTKLFLDSALLMSNIKERRGFILTAFFDSISPLIAHEPMKSSAEGKNK
jgi:hypothetical protein